MKLIDYDKYAKKWTPRRVILLLLTQALVTGLSGRNDNGRHVSPQIFGLDFHARFGILQRRRSIAGNFASVAQLSEVRRGANNGSSSPLAIRSSAHMIMPLPPTPSWTLMRERSRRRAT
jgi:hypothetical protein